MEIIKTQVHTIIMLIGPSGSGKTTFAKHVLIPALEKPFNEYKNFKPNVQYISSDAIRQELLGMEADKFDNIMSETSELAFKLLFTKLDLLTTYPVNAEYIVLDTTGLSDEFRDQVVELADKNNYNVDAIIFDYKKVDEYKKNFTNSQNKGRETSGKIIASHIKRLRMEVLKTIKRGKYRNITTIRSKDFVTESPSGVITPMCQVESWDHHRYEDRILPHGYDWVTIGDVHGCIDELKELLTKYGFEIDGLEMRDTERSKNVGIIFVGDLVDKASPQALEETIRFIHKNMDAFGDRFHMVLGNHEEMVWKWTTDDHSLEKTAERLWQKEHYYNTTFVLEQNEEVRTMFLEIFAKMKGWVKTIGKNKRSFIVTHAPCEIKYLEKMNKKSLMKQYKCASRSKNKGMSNDELTPYLMSEAVTNQPLHIFGHMGQTNVRSFRNKVCIDTGCVYGNHLTGYSVTAGTRPFIQSVGAKVVREARNDYSNDLFSIETKQEADKVRIENLSYQNQNRLNYIMENGIGYIGGTISPTDKDVETGKLESLKAGLDHYKTKVESVVLQPKYMGSRAQMYLNRDITKCYATSRNGYKIRMDLNAIFEAEIEKQKALMDSMGVDELVLDGELMPWSALGEGLINNQFRVVDVAVKSEIDFLKANGFDESFETLVNTYKESGYEEAKNKMQKSELQEKFGHAYNNYKYVKSESDRWQTIDKHQEAWEVFNEQVQLYGADGEVHFKPFRILKGVKADGTVVAITMNNAEQFAAINSDSFHIVDFADPDYQAKADKWYADTIDSNKMEGCVIKPLDTTFNPHITPFMKVRNPRYLTIIYGYDMYFPKKFEKLFNQKNINGKVRCSKNEYRIGEQMLTMDITSNEFKQLVANFMFENENERGIDPRL